MVDDLDSSIQGDNERGLKQHLNKDDQEVKITENKSMKPEFLNKDVYRLFEEDEINPKNDEYSI